MVGARKQQPRKSIAVQIAELSNPVPRDDDSDVEEHWRDADADAEVTEHTAVRGPSGSGASSRAQRAPPVSSAPLLRGGIALSEGKYAGRVGSRGKVMDASSDDDDDDDDDDDADAMTSSDETNDAGERSLSDGSSSDSVSDRDDDDDDADADSDHSVSDGVANDEQSDGDSDDSDADDKREAAFMHAEDDAGDEDLYKSLAEVQADEEKQTIQRAGATAAELEKALHVKNQQDLLDRAVELRIKMQKAVQLAHVMPLPDASAALDAVAGVSEARGRAASAAAAFVEEALSMCTRGASEAPSASGASSSKKRSAREAELPVADALWARISKQNAAVDDDVAVVEKWYRRIHAASSANLQVLNQSFRSQVDNALLDTEKLLVRAQSRRNVPRIIGEMAALRAHSSSGKVVQSVDQTAELTAMLDKRCEELFDDSDFYQSLLRDLIQNSTVNESSDMAAAGRRWVELQKLRTKQRKVVDRRASKGRKIRYVTIEKLVGFMAPNVQPSAAMDEHVRHELVASLFGNTPAQPRADEAQAVPETKGGRPASSGLRLFM